MPGNSDMQHIAGYFAISLSPTLRTKVTSAGFMSWALSAKAGAPPTDEGHPQDALEEGVGS